MEIVAADIGGTHARFAIAEVAEGRVKSLGRIETLRTSDYPDLPSAWNAFAEQAGGRLPVDAGIAVAGPVRTESFKLTNNDWLIEPAVLETQLGLDRLILVNDFGAVGHAVAQLGEEHFDQICGPRTPLAEKEIVSIVGPGTGLGVAQLVRADRGYSVVETEGGHMSFAPQDGFEDRLLEGLRTRFGRVSVERVASGAGLAEIHALVTGSEERVDERTLWTAALAGTEAKAAVSLERWCRALGSIAGDVALVQGAQAVVIAGGLGFRLRRQLHEPPFAEGLTNKGRFSGVVRSLPVKVVTYPEPGLYGAAAAFAARY